MSDLYQVAKDVIAGKYGNGNERTNKLKNEGYDADAVQNIVNKILGGTYEPEERKPMSIDIDLSKVSELILNFK